MDPKAKLRMKYRENVFCNIDKPCLTSSVTSDNV